MTKNNILKIEIVLKEFGLTNLGIVIFNNRFLKKYEQKSMNLNLQICLKQNGHLI